MDISNIKKLDDIISTFKSQKNYELELKYDDIISKEIYEKIIDFYKNKGLVPIETSTLDIIFENAKTNYRITIDENEIDKYDKSNNITPEMIKEILIKEKIAKFKPLIIDDFNFKFNMKIENPITDKALIKKLLKNLPSYLKYFRLKKRTSFKSNDDIYMYDFTIVKDYNNKIFSKAAIISNKENYEIEIECIDKSSKLNGSNYSNISIELYNIINNDDNDDDNDNEDNDDNDDDKDNEDKDDKDNDLKWILPNRIGYNEKIFRNFNPEKYEISIKKPECKCEKDVCELVEDTSIKLFPQQQVIKDYFQFNSPYRGALLYHELGSGKSGASIAAAEGYIGKKKIFVLSPASLAVNYENEILKISSIGLNLKKDWTLIKISKSNEIILDILKTKYAITSTIIKKDGLVWVPLYENDIPGATIIRTIPTVDDKLLITATTSHIIKNRYTFISYNGLSANLIKTLGTSPFDNSFIIIDEVHNFISRVVNGSKLARIIYGFLMSAKNSKIILLSGTPMINNPYEIATLINLIRGYMVVYELNYSKTSKTITIEEFISQMKDYNNIIDEFTIDNEKRRILLSLLPIGFKRNNKDEIYKSEWEGIPEDMIKKIINKLNLMNGIKFNLNFNIYNYSALPNNKEEFNKYFLDVNDEENPSVKNEDLFIRRILGTVSYYSISNSDLFPTVLPEIKRELYMTDSQYKNYVEARNYEIKQDLKKKKGNGLFTENTSVYRAFTRAVCNFSFPEEIERVYPKDIKKLMKAMNNESDDEDEYKGGFGEITKNDVKIMKQDLTKLKKELTKMKDNVKKLKEESDSIKERLKKEKEDKKLNQKELKEIENKSKKLTKELKEEKEKVKELTKETKELDVKIKETEKALKNNVPIKKDDIIIKKDDVIIKQDEDIIDINEEYSNQMKIMMDKLLASDALDIENLKNHYSPKFAQIVKDVEESPGSVLIYSSFRTLEGLGILSEVFNRLGYKQILLKKIENNYYFADADIFDKKYDNKRYVIFDQDKDKTKLLMNLFNNDSDNITNEMFKALPKNSEQLYGKLVKFFCITQSGAEGISLKNVRRVILVEPFWNNVRIEQVVGRAIRSCSHKALPDKDRNVQVFSYIMKLTKKQADEDFNIDRNDKGLTTDEHILMTANKKKFIINKFLNMLKSASFDCVINSKQNKPLTNTFKCYTWALGVNNNDFSYTNDINNDYKIMRHKNMQIAKKAKGRVVMKKGIKYVELEGKYYNYFSYLNAGVLIQENI
jgi:hypothetical protein